MEETTTRYYHVVHETYAADEPIYSRNRAYEKGFSTPWKWEGEEEDYLNGDVVCLHSTLEDAEEFVADWGGIILAVDLPADEDERREWGIHLTRDAEGYDAVVGEIPACFVSVLQ